MQRTQPDYSVQDLAGIRVPVLIAQGEGEEFIKRDHAEHLAKSIPGAGVGYSSRGEPFRAAAEA